MILNNSSMSLRCTLDACHLAPCCERSLTEQPVGQGAYQMLTLIECNGAFVLADEGLLLVERLFRDGVLTPEHFIAVEVNARLSQKGLVTGQLPLSLPQLRLVRSCVDLGEEIAFLRGLPFLKMDVHKLSINPAMDSDRVERSDRAEPSQIHGEIPLSRGRRHHGDTWIAWLRGCRGGLL